MKLGGEAIAKYQKPENHKTLKFRNYRDAFFGVPFLFLHLSKSVDVENETILGMMEDGKGLKNKQTSETPTRAQKKRKERVMTTTFEQKMDLLKKLTPNGVDPADIVWGEEGVDENGAPYVYFKSINLLAASPGLITAPHHMGAVSLEGEVLWASNI